MQSQLYPTLRAATRPNVSAVPWLHVRECLAPVSIATVRKHWIADVLEVACIVVAGFAAALMMTY